MSDKITKGQFICKSKDMKNIYRVAKNVAQLNVNVLISGESGCGKATLARLIHKYSSKGRFFVFDTLNCKDDKLSEMENIVNNAFSCCENGTLFINNIAGASKKLQLMLLETIKNKKNNENFRIISSTNRDLLDLSRHGRFNKELCNILSVISLIIPPLRSRIEDIEELTKTFIQEQFLSNGKKYHIPEDTLNILLKYDWPGNVRELKNAVLQGCLSSDNNELLPNHLPLKVRKKNIILSPKATVTDELYKLAKGLIDGGKHSEKVSAFDEYLQIVEKPLIQAAMDICKGNKSSAAKALKINRNTLSKKLQEYGIE